MTRRGHPGEVGVKPGAVNVIQDEVNFSIDVRRPKDESKQRLVAAIRARCEAIAQERGLAVSSEITSDSLPSAMKKHLCALLVTEGKNHSSTRNNEKRPWNWVPLANLS